MNILLMTSSMKQPDDRDKSKTDVAFYFAQEWAKLGHKVVVIHSESKFPLIFYKLPKFVYTIIGGERSMTIPSVGSRKKLQRTQDGIEIYRLPMFKIKPHATYLGCQYKKQIEKIQSYLEKIDFIPDVITGHWLEPQLRLVSVLGKKYNAKTGFVLHGVFPANLKESYKAYLNGLNCFFLRSDSAKADVLSSKAGRFLPEKVRICYSGIPEAFVSNIVSRSDWKSDGVFKIIFVGRLVKYKRIDAVLQALKDRFENVNYRFDIIGDGSEKENLKAIARKLEISDKVVFHGRVQRDDVQAMLKAADCFVMISENEVFGLVYLEAMAAGCVTVASRNGGVDGIIVNDENGFLCEQGNSDALGDLLDKIYNFSPDEVSRIRENAYATIPEFTDRKVAEKYLQDITE